MDQVSERLMDFVAPAPRPWWLVRGGRGRVGGSTFADFVIQWSRRRGRRVKALDGDLRSRTLSSLYPPVTAAGSAVVDAATSPSSEDMTAIIDWLGGELDASVDDGVCRVVDLGGGDRVVQEYGRDLRIGTFCEEVGIGLVWAFILGPDPEDLQHVVEVINSGHVTGGRVLLVLNEGVMRQGQSTEGVFDRTTATPDYVGLVRGGAMSILMPRLSCMGQLRERGLGFYAAADGDLDATGRRASPTLRHMAGHWVKAMERELVGSDAAEWLR